MIGHATRTSRFASLVIPLPEGWELPDYADGRSSSRKGMSVIFVYP